MELLPKRKGWWERIPRIFQIKDKKPWGGGQSDPVLSSSVSQTCVTTKAFPSKGGGKKSCKFCPRSQCSIGLDFSRAAPLTIFHIGYFRFYVV